MKQKTALWIAFFIICIAIALIINSKEDVTNNLNENVNEASINWTNKVIINTNFNFPNPFEQAIPELELIPINYQKVKLYKEGFVNVNCTSRITYCNLSLWGNQCSDGGCQKHYYYYSEEVWLPK